MKFIKQILTIVFKRNYLHKYNITLLGFGFALTVGPGYLVNIQYIFKNSNTKFLVHLSNLSSSAKIYLEVLGIFLILISLFNYYKLIKANKHNKTDITVTSSINIETITILKKIYKHLIVIKRWADRELIHKTDADYSFNKLFSINNEFSNLNFSESDIIAMCDKLNNLIELLSIDLSVNSININVRNSTMTLLDELIDLTDKIVKKYGA